jgi:glycosyltransferase involved in cell wall biosynthesis
VAAALSSTAEMERRLRSRGATLLGTCYRISLVRGSDGPQTGTSCARILRIPPATVAVSSSSSAPLHGSRALPGSHEDTTISGPNIVARDEGNAGALRVLLLNYEYPPLGGGAGVASAALAQRLSARGVVVDVVTSRPDGAHDAGRRDGLSCVELAPKLTLFRVRSKRRGVHQAGFFGAGSYLFSAVPVARRLLRAHRYDIVHIYFSLPTGALIPALPLGKTPVVVSLRGSDVPGYDERNAKLVLAHRVLRPFTRWIWKRASRVVPVCESLGALARETSPTLAYSVIGNGVDLDLFRPGSGKRSRDQAPVRCLAITRLIDRKGVADLLRAWSLLPRTRYRLEIAGGGPQDAALRALAAELGVTDDVHFAGPLSRDEVAARCQHSDVFVLTPHEEAFGNVFAEALAAGLPVVASNIGAIPDLVHDGENGILVQAGDPAAIARAIRELGDDPERRAAMATRNRARAESLLSWDTAADRYLALYAELLGHARSQHAAHDATVSQSRPVAAPSAIGQ